MNPHSDEFSHLVFVLIRKGQEIKTHMFKLHNKLVTEPFIDTIKWTR